MAMPPNDYLKLVLLSSRTSTALLQTCDRFIQSIKNDRTNPKYQDILGVMLTKLKIRATILEKINPTFVKLSYNTCAVTPYVSEFNHLIKLNMELETEIRRAYNTLL